MRSFLSAVSYSRFLVTAGIVISIASSVAAIRQRRYDFESHVALLRGRSALLNPPAKCQPT
jgi:hypothetical protein